MKSVWEYYVGQCRIITLIICFVIGLSLVSTQAFLNVLAIQAQLTSSQSIQSQGTILGSAPQTNLAVIPDGWHTTYGTGPQIIFLDYSVYRSSPPSIRLEGHTSADMNAAREINGKWFAVKPGDRILVSVWARTAPSNFKPQDYYRGARIGIDFYAHTGQGYAILYSSNSSQSATGLPTWSGTSQFGATNIGAGWKIPPGTDWTQIGWEVTVPSTYFSYVASGGASANLGTIVPCDPVQIDSFVCWLDGRPIDDPNPIWFADAELYIVPS